MRGLFLILAFIVGGSVIAQNKINRYQYWFDNNYAGRTETAVTPTQNLALTTSVSAVALTPGLHAVHMRFRDDSLRWSSCLSQFFFRLPPATPASVTMTGCEYWFDSNYQGRIYVPIAPQQNPTVNITANAAALVAGLHAVHIRFKDTQGAWSSVVSQFFFRNPPQSVTHELNTYQYWFDNNFGNAVTTSLSPAQNITLITSLNAAALTTGIHVFHLRFRDNTGEWSSVVSQFIFRNELGSATAIDTWQYWYDNNFASAVTQIVPPQQNLTLSTNLSATALSTGLHAVNIRFRDTTGKWSSVVSQFFQVNPVNGGVNTITAYRYWFDTNDSAITQVQVSPAQNATVNNAISLIAIPHGTHTVHFQFQDSSGAWSTATTDTIQKLALPIAMFSANDTIFCDSGTVAFMDHSIDGDIFSWNFGDGDTSNIQNPSHLYTSPGLYNVTLTITDTASGRDSSSTLVQYIRVYNTPSAALTVAPGDTICAGQTATLTADTNATYSWSSGATTQTETVSATGDYWATISNSSYAGCFVVSDTVHIEVMPLPIVNLGSDTSFCDGSGFLLDAFNSGSSYLWNTGATSQAITATAGGAFWVSVTSQYGCQTTDSILLTVDSLPVAAFTSNFTGLTGTFTDASTNATLWSWDFGDGNYSSLQNPSHTYAASGTYTVTLIVSNICDSDTITNIVVITGTPDYGNSTASVSVYPNPASDYVTVSCLSDWNGTTVLAVFDVNGRAVAPALQTNFTANAVNTIVINTSDLANGVYTLQITAGETRLSTRIVIAD